MEELGLVWSCTLPVARPLKDRRGREAPRPKSVGVLVQARPDTFVKYLGVPGRPFKHRKFPVRSAVHDTYCSH